MMALEMGRAMAHDVPYAIVHDPAMGDNPLAEMLLQRERDCPPTHRHQLCPLSGESAGGMRAL